MDVLQLYQAIIKYKPCGHWGTEGHNKLISGPGYGRLAAIVRGTKHAAKHADPKKITHAAKQYSRLLLLNFSATNPWWFKRAPQNKTKSIDIFSLKKSSHFSLKPLNPRSSLEGVGAPALSPSLFFFPPFLLSIFPLRVFFFVICFLYFFRSAIGLSLSDGL